MGGPVRSARRPRRPQNTSPSSVPTFQKKGRSAAWRFASPSFAALLDAAVVSNFKSGVLELFQHVLIANPELEAAEDEQEVKLLLDTRLSGLANMWQKRCKALEAHRNSN